MGRLRIDHKGIALLKREPPMHVFINAVGQIVADTARGTGPRRTGHYDTSIETMMMGYSDARCRVYARDFKAYWIEMGAGPSPVRGGRPFRARHTLRNAALLCGLRYNDRYAGND